MPMQQQQEVHSMSQMENGGFYIIQVLPLKQSKKPFHLETRLKSKTKKNSHSKSVARRNAFLQERANRLHENNVRVQKVVEKQRSKLNTENSKKISQLTAEIKAADEKRNELLKSQQKACAEKVAHAKKVAEEHQMKMNLLALEKKTKIENQQKLVASRRKHLLTVPRSQLLNLQDFSIEELKELKLTLDESAVCIQNWWTRAKLAPLLDEFKNSNVTFSYCKDLDFGKLVKIMQQKSVIKTATGIIDIVKKMKSDNKWKNPSRVFLSSYMIATHPEEAMPKIGEEEETLQKSAEAMINAFEELLDGYSQVKIRELTMKFLNTFEHYYTTFDEWKANDTKKIVDGMIQHWLELEKLWFSVRHTQLDAETEWHPKIAAQQKSIQKKIAKFGLAAIQRLKREQKKQREELGVHDEVSAAPVDSSANESASSATESDPADLLSTSPQSFPTGSFMKKHDSVKMSRRASSSAGSSRSASPISFAPAPVAPKDSPKMVPVQPKAQSANPISAAPELPTQYGTALSNERLARELSRNPDFQLKPAKKSKLERKVSAMAKKAFFDGAREQFSAGNYSKFAPSLIEDIRTELLGMVSEKGKIAAEIREHLDMDLIRQQIERKVFSADDCTAYIISKMTQLCAPVRDQEIRNLANITDLATKFQKTLEILDEMKLDLINFRLKSLAPTLKKQAVEYEKSKFDAALSEGRVNLERTTEWLKTSHKNLDDIANARNPENVVHPDNKIRFEDVYNEALMKLLFTNKAVTFENVPETFTLDAEYIFQLQNQAQLIIIVSALLMLAKNAVSDLRRDHDATVALRDRLMSMLKQEDDDDDDDQHAESNQISVENLSHEILRVCNATLEKRANEKNVPKEELELSQDTQDLIRKVVEKTLSTKDKLYSMLSRRVEGMVRGQLNTGQFKSVTGASIHSAGLDLVETELRDLSKKVYLLAQHNKEVHAAHYDSILKGIIEP